jgi:hypothetical protein
MPADKAKTAAGKADAPALRTAGATFVVTTTQASGTKSSGGKNDKKAAKAAAELPTQAALSIWRAAGSVGMPPHSGNDRRATEVLSPLR